MPLKPGRIPTPSWLNSGLGLTLPIPQTPRWVIQRFRLEVWTTTLARIRKIEAMMAGKQR